MNNNYNYYNKINNNMKNIKKNIPVNINIHKNIFLELYSSSESDTEIDSNSVNSIDSFNNKNNMSNNNLANSIMSDNTNNLTNINVNTNTNINTDKQYKDPVILNNINLEKYFNKNDIEIAQLNNKQLQISDKGLYSISKYYDAEWISNIILTFLKNINIVAENEYIIDATAGIGGNTINFSKYFRHVYSIEINNVHFNILNNNLNALSITNVTTLCDNFINIIKYIEPDKQNKILFFDPPWGGFFYKNYQYFNLKIGNMTVYDTINIMYDNNYKVVILKAPFNLNLSMVYGNIKYKNMNVHSNDKKNMLIVILY